MDAGFVGNAGALSTIVPRFSHGTPGTSKPAKPARRLLAASRGMSDNEAGRTVPIYWSKNSIPERRETVRQLAWRRTWHRSDYWLCLLGTAATIGGLLSAVNAMHNMLANLVIIPIGGALAGMISGQAANVIARREVQKILAEDNEEGNRTSFPT